MTVWASSAHGTGKKKNIVEEDLATSVKKEFEIVTHAGEALRPPSLEGKDKYASVKVILR